MTTPISGLASREQMALVELEALACRADDRRLCAGSCLVRQKEPESGQAQPHQHHRLRMVVEI